MKDAAAIAIYGKAAMYGVVVITLKDKLSAKEFGLLNLI